MLRENWQNYIKGQAIKRIALLLGNGLMVSEGEFWKAQRRDDPAGVSSHRDRVAGRDDDGIQRRVAETMAGGGSQARVNVNVTRDVSGMVLEVMLRSIFGVDYAEVAPHFNILSEETARNLEFAQAFRLFEQIIVGLATQRRAQKKAATDILGMLMEARDQKTGAAMSDRQLVNEIKTLIVAGHETTASTLNWTWYLLSQHPEVEEKLSRELSFAGRRVSQSAMSCRSFLTRAR